jgi:ubiquitin-conjugating enzyme E2 Q
VLLLFYDVDDVSVMLVCGHAGGSICVKDLTRSGWSAEFQLQPFFVMIRNLLLEGGALVDMDNYATDYSEQEAREAFDRVARAHGWEP